MKKVLITLLLLLFITNSFSESNMAQSSEPGFNDNVIDNPVAPIDNEIIALLGVAILYGLYKKGITNRNP
jgi:hypothetical protein